MERLFAFLRNFSSIIVFAILEFIAFMLVVQFNHRQSKSFQVFTLGITGNIDERRKSVTDYFNLSEKNEELKTENLLLHQEIEHLKTQLKQFAKNEKLEFLPDSLKKTSSFKFMSANVVKNSVENNYNYITIDKGSKHGVKKGMGVTSANGTVGIVAATSKNFSLVMSMLNVDFKLSSKILSDNSFGTFTWTGESPYFGTMQFVPLHINLHKGDTIVSSGYSSIFPEGYRIGFIHSWDENHQDGFYTIKVRLATDFKRLGNVYLIENAYYDEITKLQNTINIDKKPN